MSKSTSTLGLKSHGRGVSAKPAPVRQRGHVMLTLSGEEHAEAKRQAEDARLPLSRWVARLVLEEQRRSKRRATKRKTARPEG